MPHSIKQEKNSHNLSQNWSRARKSSLISTLTCWDNITWPAEIRYMHVLQFYMMNILENRFLPEINHGMERYMHSPSRAAVLHQWINKNYYYGASIEHDITKDWQPGFLEWFMFLGKLNPKKFIFCKNCWFTHGSCWFGIKFKYSVNLTLIAWT